MDSTKPTYNATLTKFDPENTRRNVGKFMDNLADQALEQRIEKFRQDFDKEFEQGKFAEYGETPKAEILEKEIEKMKHHYETNPDTHFKGYKSPEPARNELSDDDEELLEKITRKKNEYSKKLQTSIGNNNKDERRRKDLADFELDPYEFMKMDLNREISKKIRSEIIDNTRKRDDLDAWKANNKITQDKETLNALNRAFDRNIPLKLDTLFTPKEIKLSNGKSFNIENLKEEISRYIGKKNSNYEIVDVVRRKNIDFVVLKTDEGEIEINIDDLEKIFNDKENKNTTPGKKIEEDKFSKITELENELGFKINSSAVLERYLHMNKEEARVLFEQYNTSTKKEDSQPIPAVEEVPKVLTEKEELMNQFKVMLQTRMKRKQELQGMKNQLKEIEKQLDLQKLKDREEYDKKIKQEEKDKNDKEYINYVEERKNAGESPSYIANRLEERGLTTHPLYIESINQMIKSEFVSWKNQLTMIHGKVNLEKLEALCKVFADKINELKVKIKVDVMTENKKDFDDIEKLINDIEKRSK